VICLKDSGTFISCLEGRVVTEKTWNF